MSKAGHAGILQAMMKLAAEQRERQEAQRQREKELAAVKVSAWGGVLVSGMAAAADVALGIAACRCCSASAFTLSFSPGAVLRAVLVRCSFCGACPPTMGEGSGCRKWCVRPAVSNR